MAEKWETIEIRKYNRTFGIPIKKTNAVLSKDTKINK